MNEAKLRDLLFGNDIRKVSVPELEKRTGICARTLYSYKSDPKYMPIWKMAAIAKAVGVTAEQLAEVFR